MAEHLLRLDGGVFFADLPRNADDFSLGEAQKVVHI